MSARSLDPEEEELSIERAFNYRHEGVVEGCASEGPLLYTLTDSEVYVWDSDERRLVQRVPLPNHGAGSGTGDFFFVKNSGPEEFPNKERDSGSEDIACIFGNKKLVCLKKFLVTGFVRKQGFLPFARSGTSIYYVEDNQRIIKLAGGASVHVGDVGRRWGLCTQIKLYDGSLYLSFDGGRIIKVGKRRKPGGEEECMEAEEVAGCTMDDPILDFAILDGQMVVCYFGKRMIKKKIGDVSGETLKKCPAKEQVKNIFAIGKASRVVGGEAGVFWGVTEKKLLVFDANLDLRSTKKFRLPIKFASPTSASGAAVYLGFGDGSLIEFQLSIGDTTRWGYRSIEF